MPTSIAPPRVNVSFEDTSVAFSSKSNFQLKKTYLLFALMNQPWVVKLGTFFIKLALLLHLPVKWAIKSTLFGQFCGGETIKECEKTIQNLSKANIGTILDYSVEGEDSESSFDHTAQEILKTIEKAAQKTNDIPFSVFKVTGVASSVLMEKIQSGQLLEETEKKDFERVQQRLDMLCKKAHSLNVKIFIDAEESWIQDVIDTLAYTNMKKYNKQKTIVHNTYQFYRSDMLENLQKATREAKLDGYLVGAKLVRGAYLEKERLRAHEGEYQDPIHTTKEATDRDFNKAIEFCIESRDVVSICLGTHNEESCLHCVELMDHKQIVHNDPHVWFAQLLGMSDNISYNLAKAGFNVAKYVPYGPVDAVMPYLFRRAEENKSISGQTSREYLLIKNEVQRRQC
ncbi:MAG: proline dehydrogenase [Runella slithyformis]|nr:MAG: proline dehydrogenase [Runella slithyformis]TAF97847.1 MAG: proline dehydrogenase [Runella sp.]TAG21983.1 MAG: proline dehydrogenase [Cytophagales bacterium]TAG38645.1 MAG: proline dehydrogenase [Cytophagia bacterium]TAF28838.1 MAG: proline dehydrogenase [Runella slithyformis]